MLKSYFTLICSLLSGIALANCSFDISDVQPCGGEQVDFTVTSGGGNYSWDFDNDGVIDAFGNQSNFTFPVSASTITYDVQLYQNGVLCDHQQVFVQPAPDASIGVIAGSGIMDGNNIRICNSATDAELSIFNSSSTLPINETYYIDWGDGSQDTYTNLEFSNTQYVSHTYSAYGYYNIEVVVETANGCTNQETYVFYNGSNPSVGLANPGNTVGLCAPVTVDFPISNTGANPVGTEYEIYVSGVLVASYSQSNIPPVFSYLFQESSCGEETSTSNYQNAYDIQIIATNPCGSSQATIEPIEISEPPEIEMEMDGPRIGCTSDAFNPVNASQILEVNNGNCATNITPSWIITPGDANVDWTLLSGNLFAAEALEILFNLPGTYTIQMVINSDVCGEYIVMDSVQIIDEAAASTAVSLVNANVPNYPGVCAPTAAFFDNQSTGDSLLYSWTVSPDTGYVFSGNTGLDTEDLELQFTESGTYQISLTANNFCSSDTWDTTLVIANAPEATLPVFTPFCETATISFSNSIVSYQANGLPILGYQWDFPGATPSQSTDQFPQNIFYDTPGTYLYSLTINNECGTQTLQGQIIVETPPTLTMPADVIMCESDTAFQLIADPPTGMWTGTGVSPNGWFDPTQTSSSNNVLQYEYGQGACLVSGQTVVNVEPGPTVNAGPDLAFCSDRPAILLSQFSPQGGTWTVDNGGVLPANNSFDPQASGPGVYTLSYSFTDTDGCSGIDERVIVVHGPPSVDAGPDQVVCESTPGILLDNSFPSGGSWTGVGVDVQGNFNPQTAGGVGVYTLYYNYTDPSTQCDNIDSLNIEVTPSFQIEAGPDATVCASELPFAIQGASPANGEWSGVGILTGTNVFDPAISGPGTHILTYTAGDGLCQEEDNLVITVQAVPDLDLPANQQICIDEAPVPLTASPSGGTWEGPGIQQNTFYPLTAGAGVFNLTYRYIDPNTGCETSDAMEIEVILLPTIFVPDTFYCNTPGPIDLPVGQPAGGTWSGPGIVGNQFDPQIAGGAGAYTLTYSYTNSFGCQGTFAPQVTVIEATDISIADDFGVCRDNAPIDLTLLAQPAGGTWLINGTTPMNSYLFEPATALEGDNLFVYSYGSGNCRVTAPITIEVYPDPIVEAGPSVDFCQNEDLLQLTGASPDGGYWTGEGIVDSINGWFDPGTAALGTHLLVYHFQNQTTGCRASDTRQITILPYPEALFSMPDEICRNDQVFFQNFSAGQLTYEWEFGDGAGSTEENPNHIFDAAGEFEVTLLVTNTYGCQDTMMRIIEVADVPSAFFLPDTTESCNGLELNLTNLSNGIDLEYQWNFGNGETSNDPSPDVVYFGQGINDTSYIITLTVTNRCGSDLYQDIVTVHPDPQAGLGFVPQTDCSPVVINFANTSVGAVTDYFWDFGNGNTSTEPIPPNQVYFADTTQANYTVTLIASNQCGQDTAVEVVTVEPVDVFANFDASVTQGCGPLTVQFFNFATPGATVDWVFGDGNSSATPSPIHTFQEAGTYEVIQYANSYCGYDSTTMMITVLPNPETSFTSEPRVCVGTEVNFTNLSVNTSGHIWEFGDGNISQETDPVHVYDSVGIYTVRLTAVSMFNQCIGTYEATVEVGALPEIDLTASAEIGCAPLTVSFESISQNAEFFEWDFGDGNTSVDEAPFYTFEEPGDYEVRLTGTDIYGCSNDSAVVVISVFPNPDAAFSYEISQACTLPTTVEFTNESTGATAYTWIIDSVEYTDTQAASVDFQEAGSHEVMLVATNIYNCPDTFRQTIFILQRPGASFLPSASEGCTPLTVTFDNQSAAADTYYWDFGNGETSNEFSPVMTFEEPGEYEIKLVVAAQNQCFDSLETTFPISVYQSPTASFSFEEIMIDGLNSGTFQFYNESVNADYYYWDFGDGNESTEENPEHRFMENDLMSIYLEASTDYGCVDDTTFHVTPNFIKGLFLPNGFSPEHGIGEVTVWKPKGIGLVEYRAQVFSPYGQLLWESTELEDGQPVEAWDGTYNGKLQPQDVYVWKVHGIFEDGTYWVGQQSEEGGFSRIGSVILLR